MRAAKLKAMLVKDYQLMPLKSDEARLLEEEEDDDEDLPVVVDLE